MEEWSEEKKRKKKLAFLVSSSQENLPFKELSLHILGRRLWAMLALWEQSLAIEHFCSRNQKNVGSGMRFSKQPNKTPLIWLQDNFFFSMMGRIVISLFKAIHTVDINYFVHNFQASNGMQCIEFVAWPKDNITNTLFFHSSFPPIFFWNGMGEVLNHSLTPLLTLLKHLLPLLCMALQLT